MPKGKDYTPPIVCTYCRSNEVEVGLFVTYKGYCHSCKKEQTLTTEEEGNDDE